MELCTNLMVASHLVWGSYAAILGVQPKLREQYRYGPAFKCVSGSGDISWDRVNDDICDCSDGSDEPGAF
jgi:alpha-glucuronidase